MTKKHTPLKTTVIYQTKTGALELRADSSRETIWATRMQIAEIFEVQAPAISKHIQNIYKEKELEKKATSSKMELVQDESGRKVKRHVDTYNLEVLIAVGYRINSVVGTKFRQWATTTLRKYITEGYVIDPKRVVHNYQDFLKSIEAIQTLLPVHLILDPKNILELVKEFAHTFTSLEAYDKSTLTPIGSTKKSISLTGQELTEAITKLRSELIKKKEATEIFAQERAKGNIEGIVGNVMQSFSGQNLYKTAEEKAAHLLYFIVKNHPFVDGNKRSGAFAFVWFLNKVKIKGLRNINPASLTALTLLIAESDPKRKDQMTALVTQLLK
jgi:prophage maintenance system killer protein